MIQLVLKNFASGNVVRIDRDPKICEWVNELSDDGNAELARRICDRRNETEGRTFRNAKWTWREV